MTAIELEPTTTLMQEIRRYLALVDLLRREGLEPTWRSERGSTPAATVYERSVRAV